MGRLRTQDFQDLLYLTYLPNCHSDLTVIAEELLRGMERVFKVQSANFFFTDSNFKKMDLTNVISLGIEKNYLDQYARYYSRYDPFRSPQVARKIASTVRDIFPYSRWTSLEYYNDFLKPQKIHHELVIYLRAGANLLGVIGLFRPNKQENFSERDMLKAQLLAPYIAISLENLILLSRIERERNLLQSANQVLLQGVLLLDDKLQVVYCDSEAREMCLSIAHKRQGEANGAEDKYFPVPLEIVQDCLVLKQLFEGRNRTVRLHRRRIISCGKEGNRFQTRSSVVQQPRLGVYTPHFLVSLIDLCETYKIEDEILKEKHHLTEREVEIVRSVCEGLTNEKIAQKLFISRLTVGNHLKNIFEKTGVKNRTELARLTQLT